MESSGHSESAEHVIQIRRCACVVKGGRRFSFTALVVIGDRQGRVSWGYGKAPEVPQAVEKAVKQAEKRLSRMQLWMRAGSCTIPHRAAGKYGASKVVLLPASAGTGITAGGCVRSVLDAVGVTDVLTKCQGSTNPLNLVRATIDALNGLRSLEQVRRLRGVSL